MVFSLSSSVKAKDKELLLNKDFYLVCALFLILFLWSIFSPLPWMAWLGSSSALTGSLSQILLLVAFLAAYKLGPRLLKNRLWVVIFIGPAIAACLQWLNLDPFTPAGVEDSLLGRSFAFIGNPNWLSSFLLLGLPLVWMNTSGKLRVGFLSVLVMGILSTGSKAGFLGLGILVLLSLRSWKVLLCTMLVSGLVLFSFFPTWESFSRSGYARLYLWEKTAMILFEYPWGIGPEAIPFYIAPHLDSTLWEYESLTAQITHPHLWPLEILVELGLLGGVLFLLGMSLLLWRFHTHPVGLGLFAYSLSLVFGFEVFINSAIFWILMGALVGEWKEDGVKLKERVLFSGAFALCSLLFVGLLWRGLGAWEYERARVAIKAEAWESAAEWYQKSVGTYAWDRVTLLEASEYFLSLEVDQYLPLVEVYLEQLSVLSSNKDPDLAILQAWLQAREGNKEGALELLDEALNHNSADIKSYLLGLRVLGILEENDKAEALKQELLDQLPSFAGEENEQGRIFRKNYPWIFEL